MGLKRPRCGRLRPAEGWFALCEGPRETGVPLLREGSNPAAVSYSRAIDHEVGAPCAPYVHRDKQGFWQCHRSAPNSPPMGLKRPRFGRLRPVGGSVRGSPRLRWTSMEWSLSRSFGSLASVQARCGVACGRGRCCDCTRGFTGLDTCPRRRRRDTWRRYWPVGRTLCFRIARRPPSGAFGRTSGPESMSRRRGGGGERRLGSTRTATDRLSPWIGRRSMASPVRTWRGRCWTTQEWRRSGSYGRRSVRRRYCGGWTRRPHGP
jgi:hypothetical protein